MSDMVTIHRPSTSRLIEAAEDLADVKAFDRALAAGGDGMPHDALERIIAGGEPVTVIREWRGLTAAELARRAGMRRVQIPRYRNRQAGRVNHDHEADRRRARRSAR